MLFLSLEDSLLHSLPCTECCCSHTANRLTSCHCSGATSQTETDDHDSDYRPYGGLSCSAVLACSCVYGTCTYCSCGGKYIKLIISLL